MAGSNGKSARETAVAKPSPLVTLLKREGPMDVTTLAAKLGVSTAAVRLQLCELGGQGLATFEEEARPLGRPAKIWRLTVAADRLFPTAHAEFALRFLNGARRAYGCEGITQIIREMACAQMEDYRDAINHLGSLGEKVDALAAIRSQDGYMAEAWQEQDGSYLLVENHCPVSKVANSCSVICEAEFDVFKDILGRKVTLERREHMASGDRRCVYCISERGSGTEEAPEAGGN